MKLSTYRILLILFCIIAIPLTYIAAFANRPVVMFVIAAGVLVMVVLNFKFNRCPHCKEYLGKTPMHATYCPIAARICISNKI